eukprot:3935228-Rhodomonas_salina.2
MSVPTEIERRDRNRAARGMVRQSEKERESQGEYEWCVCVREREREQEREKTRERESEQTSGSRTASLERGSEYLSFKGVRQCIRRWRPLAAQSAMSVPHTAQRRQMGVPDHTGCFLPPPLQQSPHTTHRCPQSLPATEPSLSLSAPHHCICLLLAAPPPLSTPKPAAPSCERQRGVRCDNIASGRA